MGTVMFTKGDIVVLMKKQGFADQVVGKIWICIVRSAGRKPSNALTPGPTRPTIGKGKERVSHSLPKIEQGSHASWVLMIVILSKDLQRFSFPISKVTWFVY